MKKTILALIFGSVLISSCKKDDKTCNLDSNTVIGSYKTTSVKSKSSASSPAVEVYNTTSGYYDACELDDVIIFGASGIATFQDAGTSCSPSGTSVTTWTLTGTTLTVDGEPGVVSNFSCGGMTITTTDSSSGSSLEITLVKL